MLKKILIGFALLIGLLLIFIAREPNHFRIERSELMQAPAFTVFNQVNNFHNWEKWSPWAKLDPTAKNSYEGSFLGKGARFTWAGNNEVGAGSMTILDSRSPDRIVIKLDFIKPFAAVNLATFTFTPEQNMTRVTWTMTGKRNLLSKLIGLFIDCDKMVGEMFEKGLSQMKTVVEAPATPAPANP